MSLSCAFALVLALDASRSVDEDEWKIQVEGHAGAVLSHDFLNVVEKDGGAVAVITFDNEARTEIGWTVLRTRQDAVKLAQGLSAIPQPMGTWTSISDAMRLGMDLMESAPCGENRAIDISTDGINNHGERTEGQRDRAYAQGVKVNVLAIGLSEKDVKVNQDTVVTPGGFLIESQDWEDFARAIRRKITLEVAGVDR